MQHIHFSFKSLALAALFLLSAAMASAAKPDFSGMYTLQGQEGISGKLYGNGVPKELIITQKKDAITFENIYPGTNGDDVTVTEVVRLDGKDSQAVTPSGRKKIMTLKWSEDGKSLMQTTTVFSLEDPAKKEQLRIDHWSFFGGQLILVRKAQNFVNPEQWESKSIYQK